MFRRRAKPFSYTRLGSFSSSAKQSVVAGTGPPGWRPLLRGGAWVLGICLLANTIFLIWASKTADTEGTGEDGVKLLYKGSCQKASSIKTWAHLAINVCSTLILGVSTSGMQCLSAPTREEIDRAHSKGDYLDVGILSVRNLGRIARKRVFLWLILAVASLPLHFLYNSVVVFTSSGYDSLVVLASSDIDFHQPFNSTEVTSQPPLIIPGWAPGHDAPHSEDNSITHEDLALNTALEELFRSNNSADGSARQLNIDDCFSYFSAVLLTSRSNVVIVTTKTFHPGLQPISINVPMGRGQWSCIDPNQMFAPGAHTGQMGNGDCDRSSVFPGYPASHPLPDGFWQLDHCLVTNSDETDQCSIIFSVSLISVVIAMVAVKLAVILCMLLRLDFHPMVTTGDIIQSFLSRPDLHTTDVRPHSEADVRQAWRLELTRVISETTLSNKMLQSVLQHKIESHREMLHDNTYHSRKYRYAAAASKTRWFITLTTGLLLEIVAALLIFVVRSTAYSNSIASDWSQSRVLGGDKGTDWITIISTFFASVLLANLPQFLISSYYVAYMGLMTSMLSNVELNDYTVAAKTLRVSAGRSGGQRSTYFLQLPYRYTIPVMTVMITLHWMVSQAIFVVRVDRYGINDQLLQAGAVDTVGYSVKATITAMGIGFALILLPIAVGSRRLREGMPLLGNNSIALSIACHPAREEAEKMWEKPIKYGLVRSINPEGKARTRIGFATGEVERLRGGESIENTPRCLSTMMIPVVMKNLNCSMDESLPVLYDYVRKRL